jgi:hypothetical protein
LLYFLIKFNQGSPSVNQHMELWMEDKIIIVNLAPKQPPAASTTPTWNSSERRIFRALLAIMVLVVGAYFSTCVVTLATASVTSPFYQQYAGPIINNLLAQCAATCNTPLLLAFR